MSTTTSTFQVAGMTCSHCVTAVRSEISALPGVTDVSVELAPDALSTVTVTAVSDLSDVDVAAAVQEAGYELATVS